MFPTFSFKLARINILNGNLLRVCVCFYFITGLSVSGENAKTGANFQYTINGVNSFGNEKAFNN